MGFIIFLSEAMVSLMIFYIVGFGLLLGHPVLDDFIDGARGGMKTVAGTLPTLAEFMVSVGILRTSGFLDFLGKMLVTPAALIHFPLQTTSVVPVRLVSNSAATGLILNISREFGTDSSIGLTASILMSSTETVLYCMNVCFDSVGIRKARCMLAGGLIATAAGVVVSVVLAGVVSG